MKLVKYTSKDITMLTDRVSGAFEGVGYRDCNEMATRFLLSKKEFCIYAFSKEFKSSLPTTYYFRWADDMILRNAIGRYSEFVPVILEHSGDNRLVEAFVASSAFNPLEHFDELISSPNHNIRHRAALYCDVKTLISLKDDRSKKVRKVVYQRLGPVGHLDDMLTDKAAEIRYLGVTMAPVGYAKLSDMTGEIARQVFTELIQKIDQKDLPMLLANRNLKNSYIESIFEARMYSE